MGFVIVILVVVAVGWLFLALPARRRQRSHGEMQDAIVEGDEIITAGGPPPGPRGGDGGRPPRGRARGERQRAPDRDRAGGRGDPRPAGGCGSRARNTSFGRRSR